MRAILWRQTATSLISKTFLLWRRFWRLARIRQLVPGTFVADVLCHFANPDRHQNGMFALFHEGNTWQNDLSMYFLLRLVFFEGSRRVYQATRGSPLNAKSRGIFISKSQSGTYVFALQDVLKIAWNLKGNPVFEPYRSQRWRLQLVLF